MQEESTVRGILEPIDPGSRGRQTAKFKEKSDDRHPNTCTWTSTDPDILNWVHSTDQKLLWIYAIPGAGKSVVAAYVIEHLVRNLIWSEQQGTELFYFCEHANIGQAKAGEVMRALALQVLNITLDTEFEGGAQLRAEIFDHLKRLEQNDFVKFSNRVDESVRKKFAALLGSVGKRGTIWLILDGLDEYDDQTGKSLLRFLSSLYQDIDLPLKIIIFSRREDFIHRSLQNTFKGK
jgi:hypothetical protein